MLAPQGSELIVVSLLCKKRERGTRNKAVMSQSSDKSEIAQAYNEWAETYDTNANLTRDLAGRALRQTNLQLDDRTVVEVGCGTGRNTAWLAQRASTIIALDFSDQMLARARANVSAPNVQFIQHDLHNSWPVPDSSAQLVIAMLVLEHVENLTTFFAHAERVLTTGGELFVCELHPKRQLAGGQAQFSNPRTGERKLVTAFLHNVSEYVNAGLAARLQLTSLGEWRDDEGDRNSPPRLLSLTYTAP